MTDRIRGCWVAFEDDIRDDDVEDVVNAIMMVKRVQAVTTEKVDPRDFMARAQVKSELFAKLTTLLHEFFT